MIYYLVFLLLLLARVHRLDKYSRRKLIFSIEAVLIDEKELNKCHLYDTANQRKL
jgi:hypothetical protein